MNRREVLKAGLGSVAVASAGWMSSGPARAANWPTKTVRVIVPFSAGSATDLVPRAVFEQVSKQVGQTILVDNRPGGGGAIGIGAVRAADPDGHTILVHSNSFITTPAIQPMPWDPPRDFAGITPLGNVPLVLVIAPSQGIKTLKELVDRSKAKPGSLNYAAAGIGSPPHLTMERFRVAAGFTGQLVPFRGAPEALTEVMLLIDCSTIDVETAPAGAMRLPRAVLRWSMRRCPAGRRARRPAR
jgi:tripartite-type tricarboxylate transporter receptor subunit TctC